MKSPSATTFIALEPTRPAPGCSTSSCATSGCGDVSRYESDYADIDPEMGIDATTVAIMLTRRCNMSCAHCSVESGPRVKGEPSAEELSQIITGVAKRGIRSVILTGGEPMLRPKILLDLLRQCKAADVRSNVTSNGFWGKSSESALDTLRELQEAGLGHITISYDRYHAEFMGPEPVVNIVQAAKQLRMSMYINITRTAKDGDLSAILAPFENLGHAQLRLYDVQLLGRARKLETDALRSEIKGFCNACCTPALTDDGRMTACNGPSYFSPLHSPLQIGSLHDSSLDELLDRHQSDPILETIRTFGPSRLRDELQQLPGFENFARPDYSGMCDLCLHLTSDASAVTALRQHLEQPRLIALRAAARKMICSEQMGGHFNRQYVNTIGAASLFWRATVNGGSLDEADAGRLMGRADLDWNAQFHYLNQCGLSGLLVPALDSPSLTRWAPQFFRDGLKKQALAGGMSALIQRDAMRHIAAALREVGAQGVLLKGGAMLAQSLEAQSETGAAQAETTRFSCDLDVYIAPDKALQVRNLLIERGFRDVPLTYEVPARDDLAKRHQLDALVFRGVGIEIHQSLLAVYCGLPEREMLADVRPLRDPELAGLQVMGPEAMFLHSAVHCAKHFFMHGLKAAWDFRWILDHNPAFDWNKLERWVKKTGIRRGFWVALCVLNRRLKLNLPAEFLALAPQDKRQKRLECVAEPHLFGQFHPTLEGNPWAYHSLYFVLSDSLSHRTRHVASLVFGPYHHQVRRLRALRNPQNLKNCWRILRSARSAWKQMA